MTNAIKEDTKFLDEISSIPGGEKIRHCIQCGICSASCPMIFKMDHSPRKIFAMQRPVCARKCYPQILSGIVSPVTPATSDAPEV